MQLQVLSEPSVPFDGRGIKTRICARLKNISYATWAFDRYVIQSNKNRFS